MKYLIKLVRFPVSREYDLSRQVCAKLGISRQEFRITRILRKAVDTRKHDLPFYDFSLELEFEGKPPVHADIHPLQANPTSTLAVKRLGAIDPVIVGMGPAGLFCALALVEKGFKPILIDRGDTLEARAQKVNGYWTNGELDPESNVQFGEGGAGAWSDGKLTSRSKDPFSEKVFELMIRFGAPEEISYEALPHLGTDGIRALVKSLRRHLIDKGCQFKYRTRLEDIVIKSANLSQVKIGDNWYQPEVLILALGNSARDSFGMLARRGVMMEPKPFAAGFRIEHRQEYIDRAVYGSRKWRELLGPASYRLTHKHSGTYSFCMCPGGMVVASASELETVVTNGMSFAARDNAFCNSAIVATVDQSVYGAGLLAGMNWQQGLEQAAWKPGGFAPAIRVEDFMKGRLSSKPLTGSYMPGLRPDDLSSVLPRELGSRLRSGLSAFSRIFKEFCVDATIIAPETRTSAPVRFIRDRETMSCLNVSNLYVIGEGSGYAGGIVSSAIDGYKLGSSFEQ